MAGQIAHLFTCGSGFHGTGLFALTIDRNGGNLPKADCPAGWGFDRTIEIAGDEVGEIAFDRSAAFADLTEAGYHLFRVGDAESNRKTLGG
jgi:hypothetical protein